jgi:hypothetical protein
MSNRVPDEIVRVFKDLQNYELPRADNAFDKIKCSLMPGQKVSWYDADDLAYFKECNDEAGEELGLRNAAHYQGIVVPMPGIEYNGGELEYDECIIVITSYECEKCYPEIDWVALPRLLDDEKLIEVFNL